MADNFDLRQFLTENKLTKNAQLLKENSEFFLDAIFDSVNDSFRSGDIDDGVFNTVKGYIDSHEEELLSYQDQNPQDIADDLIAKATSGELNNINEARVEGFDVNKKAFKVSFINKYGGEGDSRILNAETPEQAEEIFTNIFVKNPDMVKSIKSIEPYQVPAPKPQAQSQPGLEGVNYGSIEIDGVDSNDYPDFVDAYVAYAEFEDGTPLSEEELYQLTDELYESGELADMAAETLYEGREKELKEGTLNEDNLEVKKAAKDLYTFLRKSGVTTTLGSNMGFGKKIGMKTPGQAEASIHYGETSMSGGQTLINISLRGMEDKVKEVESKFLTAFPNLEIVNGSKKVYKVYSGGMTGAPIPGAVNQNFTVKEKTTAKGGLAGNTQQNVNEAKSYKVSKNSKEAQHLKKGDIIGSGDEVVSVSAGAKTPSGKVEVTLKTKARKTKTSTMGKTTKVGVKEKETVKENRMTQRDRYLTRLVENALGLTEGRTERSGDPLANRPVGGIRNDQEGYKDMMTGRADNAPFSHTDSNDLRNRYTNQGAGQKPRLPEGDEMVNEKPLPKYENIEKLMQEIDKNTDEEAHKFKVQEMKRVADMLEKKCTALEEGDDADHIDQKKLKQMKKDIMTLRKGMEKLEKLGEKKFTKKETKAELKEGFDLRNFLVENKLTRNSKMISENQVELSPANREEILSMLQTWTPKRLGQTTDHLLDTVAIEVREAGYTIPQGKIPNLDSRIMAISGKYQGGVISGDEAVDMLVDLVMDRQ